MLVVMQHDAVPSDIEGVCRVIREMGYTPMPMPGGQRTAIGLLGNDGRVDDSHIIGLPGVAQVIQRVPLCIASARKAIWDRGRRL